MNSRKIYACYAAEDELLEFWSTNKKLYDTYVSVYGPYMDKNRYYHTILPISQYEEFYYSHGMSRLDVFEFAPWYGDITTPYISTLEMLEIINLDDFLLVSLELDDEFMDMIKLLPRNIRNPILQTKWAKLLTNKLTSSTVDLLDADVTVLQYIAQACYYSENNVLGLTGI